MKISGFLFLGGLMICSSPAFASGLVTCQSILSVGNGNFGELEAASSCDIGNVTISGFNTTFTASNILVSLDGVASSPPGSILGLTYSVLAGTLPAGSIGYTATFDPNAATDGAGGVACLVGDTCGIIGSEAELNSLVPSGAIVTTVDTGGFSGTSHVDAATFGGLSYQLLFPVIVAPASITKVSTYNGLGTVDNFSTEVITADVSTTPEPATFSMIGGGLLLGLGVLRRKRFFRA